MSKLKDMTQYKDLQKTMTKINNKIGHQFFRDCYVSVCTKKQQILFGLPFPGSQPILLYLIEGRHNQYKIGYKLNIEEELNGYPQIKHVPQQGHLSDFCDLSCIKQIITKKQQLTILFRNTKKRWILKFANSQICSEWYKSLRQKINSLSQCRQSSGQIRPEPPIQSRTNRQKSCSDNSLPKPSQIRPRSSSQNHYTFKELTINPINPFLFCTKKASQGKLLDHQDIYLLKTELLRIYRLGLNEQNFIKYFLGISGDMFNTMMALQRKAVIYNQKIIALQQTNKLLKQQISQCRSRTLDYVVQIIKEPSQKANRDSYNLDNLDSDSLDSTVLMLKQSHLEPISYSSKNNLTNQLKETIRRQQKGDGERRHCQLNPRQSQSVFEVESFTEPAQKQEQISPKFLKKRTS